MIREDGTAKILFGVIGLMRCGACNSQCNVSLRRQFRFVNRLRIQVKRGARLGMTEQALNRFHVFALADEKGRKAVAKVVETESVARFEPDANLNRGGANFILCHYAGA